MKNSDSFIKKAFEGEPIDQCTVIDAHGHLGECFAFPLYDNSLKGVISTMDRIGIDVWCPSPYPGLVGYAEKGNNLLIDAIKKYPGRIFGYMTVDIGYPEKINPELQRCYKKGVRSIKIYSSGIQAGLPYDHKNYKTVYEFADSHALPILAHTFNQADLDQLEKQFKKYHKINFILAHAGSFELKPYIKLAKKYKNVFLETCFSGSPRGLIEELVRQGLAEKVLWGSDMTFMSAEQQIGRVLFAQISMQDKRKILGENANNALR